MSKGTTLPRNLSEQLAVEEALANPIAGDTIIGKQGKPFEMADPRWHHSKGWVKKQYIHNEGRPSKINVHYVYNERTGMVDDFKIKL